MSSLDEQIKLTQYSHGAGCGCKIAPKILDQILSGLTVNEEFENLIVGNHEKDDAAVYDLGNGQCLLSTTDFFMPIVDDPYLFGKIAATNSISDIYAMGVSPVLAIAILGWPIDKIEVRYAAEVIKGARSVCKDAGIALAGGHSIDSPEPIFGLAVNGIGAKQHIKRNNGAKVDDLLFLSKPIGVGILSTAVKKKLCDEKEIAHAIQSMITLNKVGSVLGTLEYVHAITDVTGFGLLGHSIEMMEASNTSCQLYQEKVPVMDSVEKYLNLGSVPGGTQRNISSYLNKVSIINDFYTPILADPQTSGGLLVSIDPNYIAEFSSVVKDFDKFECFTKPIGKVTAQSDFRVTAI